MTEWIATVQVMPKPSVNDPQGLSIRNALLTLGFPVEDVRAGKSFHLRVNADRRENAEQTVRDMCEQLLANPVIETYDFTLDEAPARVP